MRRFVPLLALGLVLAGCLEGGDDAPGTGTPTTSPDDGRPAGSAVTLRHLEAGSQSAAAEARLVLRSQGEWDAFWREHTANELPPREAPAVDFATEQVVAVVLTEKPNGCWAVRVTNATTTEVEVVTYAPPPGLACIQVVSRPYHLVAMPATEGTMAFTEREGTGPPPE